MIPLSEWTRSCPLPDRPWLILGKGPSFARRHHIDLTPYNLASLNHVVRELKVEVVVNRDGWLVGNGIEHVDLASHLIFINLISRYMVARSLSREIRGSRPCSTTRYEVRNAR